MLPLQDWIVRYRLGSDALVIECDPLSVAGNIRDLRRYRLWRAPSMARPLPRPARLAINRLAREARRFDIDGRRWQRGRIEDGKTFRRMLDVWENRGKLEASETWRHIAQALRTVGLWKHKGLTITDPDRIEDLIRACFLNLLESMSREGYVAGRVTPGTTGGIAKAVVWADGTLWHENGATHRLAAARIVGLRRGFPVRVVAVHRDWLCANGIHGLCTLERLPKALQCVIGATGSPSARRDNREGRIGATTDRAKGGGRSP
ncbi:hypothetical protein SAMN05216257_1046 [Meinhardsimonia xiamenensis]|jgi:hypothetical protein|uniref:Uncharacterized protein n=1 Tax=Meinhardsimonia xiamenensis TaxID=990712 RepID=A0A1G9DT81_9RHOB|nr:hypothetical protein [Meinhardsimonia xiamenensis]PRX31213.1 hypothetical protein LV81_02721 [Meinhardsimonia xiamenensis]SDK67044.1 hypothetical protein SAMN05216257_1046 [Meinhardsimonia xiamenensis]